MHSAIYQGVINHRRNDAVQHQFQYPIFMVYLDLDEQEEFFRLSPWWSRERFNWASFRRRDYLQPQQTDLKQAVADEILRQTGEHFRGQVRVLSHFRYLGIGFNPATFYFCFADGELRYLVTEVTNTPWLERHCYVLKFAAGADAQQFVTRKQFHVSPFLPMDMEYHWKIHAPGEQLNLYISNYQDQQMVFSAGLRLQRLPATARNLNRTLLQFPMESLKTITGIYWQALRLKLKGAEFYQHSKPVEDQSL